MVDVEASFRSGTGERQRISIARELAPGAMVIVSLAGIGVRARHFRVTARAEGAGEVFTWDAVIPQGDYCRWGDVGMKRGRGGVGGVRGQTIGGQAYDPALWVVVVPAAEETGGSSREPVARYTDAATRYTELVDESGIPLELKSILFHTGDGALSLGLGLDLQPDDFLDFDLAIEKAGVTSCEIDYVRGGERRTDFVDFVTSRWSACACLRVLDEDIGRIQYTGVSGSDRSAH